jgi:hypothetical protein
MVMYLMPKNVVKKTEAGEHGALQRRRAAERRFTTSTEPAGVRSRVWFSTCMKALTIQQQQRLFDGLRRIAKGFDTAERVMKYAERDYGIGPAEALEMAYENMQETARLALKGIKRPVENSDYPEKNS